MKDQTEGQTLKQQIMTAFPNMTAAEFDRHETDLYVKHSPELYEWLRTNYRFFKSIERFISQIDRTLWLDVPFAAWDEKYGK